MADPTSGPRLCLDPAVCTTSGFCRSRLPEHLRTGSDGATELVRAEVAASELAAVRDVVLECPSGALRIDDDPLYDFPNVGP